MNAIYIGETNEDYVNGKQYALRTQKFTGRIYKPGKDANGKWLDKEGEPDNRMMVWKDGFAINPALKVFNDYNAISTDFKVVE
jgi:hypothetical protein